MGAKKEIQIIELWKDNYEEYVKSQFLTKLEALKMIANELGLNLNSVREKIDKEESKKKNN